MVTDTDMTASESEYELGPNPNRPRQRFRRTVREEAQYQSNLMRANAERLIQREQRRDRHRRRAMIRELERMRGWGMMALEVNGVPVTEQERREAIEISSDEEPVNGQIVISISSDDEEEIPMSPDGIIVILTSEDEE